MKINSASLVGPTESDLAGINANKAGINANEIEIVERVRAAVMEQRLPPGTKLGEASLCKAFGVSRMRMRRALLLLANQGIVVQQANRGAFVASPDRKTARDVFAARLLLEPGIVQEVVRIAADTTLDKLETHIRLEQQANRRDAIRLSGEFHLLLADATKNDVLIQIMRDLVAQTSLIISLFGTSRTLMCEEHEHADILAALRHRDGKRAAKLIRLHLVHIEADIDLTSDSRSKPDIASILGMPS